MSLSTIIQLLKSLLQAAFANRNDPKKWEGWVDIHGHTDPPTKVELAGKFSAASVELQGLKFVIDVNGTNVTLEAKPSILNPHKADVYIDGVLHHEAGVVVAPKNSAQHPIRVAVDFRPVTLNGDDARFNLRFNG